MNTIRILIVGISILATVFRAQADSPLTSTQFSTAYSDQEIVQKAKSQNGALNDELMAYLASKKNPIDVKLAVINELGWNFNGKNNYDLFITYLKSNGYKNDKKLIKKGGADLLICVAYIKALDNYFQVSDAISLAKKAKSRDKKSSYSVQLIAGLIEAQEAMDGNWCKVFQLCDEVRANESLKMDMRQEASDIIFEYMDLYSEYCTH